MILVINIKTFGPMVSPVFFNTVISMSGHLKLLLQCDSFSIYCFLVDKVSLELCY